MSAAPQYPPDFPRHDEPPRPHRRTWLRVLGWVFGVLALLVLIVIAGIYLLLHTNAGRQYVLGKVEQRVSASLGSRVHARDFRLSFSGISPALDMYNVVIDGANPYPTPPLLQVDHILASVQITSLLGRTWYLKDIQVDHPVVRVFVDAHGTDNLPQTSTGSGQSQTNVFDLGVRHAQLTRGEVYYNNRKSVLEADLHDLTLRSAFHPAQREYTGQLGYSDGHLRYGAYAPVPHDLQATFTATPEKFVLDRAKLTSGPSQIDLTATLAGYAHPDLTANYQALLDSNEFRRILHNSSLPAGVIRIDGSLHYVSQPDRPMLAVLSTQGTLSSPVLRVSTSSFTGDIRDLAARYQLADGNFLATITSGQVLGGTVTGTARVADISGVQKGSLDLVLHGASLAQLRSKTQSAALSNYSLSGTANVKMGANWTGSPSNVQANVVADVSGGVAGQGTATPRAQRPPPVPNKPATQPVSAVAPTAPQKPVPVRGHIQLQYNGKTNQITVAPNSYIRTPQTQVKVNGAFGKGSALQLHFHSANLHELEALLPPATAASLQNMGVAGTASFDGTLRQARGGVLLAGQLSASNLQLHGVVFPSLQTRVNYSPSSVSLNQGRLAMANGGQLSFALQAPLHNGSFVSTAPLQISATGSRLSLAALAKAAGVQVPVSGTLAIDVNLRGTELSPAGQGTIKLTQANIAGQPVQAATLAFRADGTAVNGTMTTQLPAAGNARADFMVNPSQQTYSGNLRATGIRIGELAAVKAHSVQVAGTLNINAEGRGSFDNPEFTASVSAPQLKVANQVINALTLQANVANHVANLALDSQAINTSLRGRATVQLTGQYFANATIDTQPIPLAPLVAMYAPTQAGNISGQTELHATLRGPLKNKALIDAHAVIPTLRVNYKNTVQIGAAGPIHLDYTNGVLNLQRATISGTDTNLQLQGSVPVLDRARPMSLLLVGNVDLKIAQLFSPDITSSGQVQFDINSFGQRANPNVEGQVKIVNAAFATAAAPLGMQNGNGTFTLTRDRLDINQFQASVGGGTVTATGGVIYRPALQFDMAINGRHVRMLYPEGVREAFNLKLQLAGTPQKAQLNGQVHLTDLSFTPDFDLTNLMGSFGGSTTPPPSQSFTDNLRLNVSVQSTSGVNLVSRQLSLQAAANLRVQGTADQPVLLGRINLNGGDLIFQGNRYLLQGGFIDFVDPYETKPVLNVRVNTTIQQYNIHMMFRGPVDHLQTSYTSDPSLPPSDIINLLAFGKTTEAQAANPTAPGAAGAESLIASQVSSQVTSRVSKIAGISQLSVDPVLQGSNQQNPGARITIQQRVTGNIFVTFSTDVTSTQNQIIELQYKVSPRLSLSGTRDQNGGFGFDARIKKTW